MIVEFARLDERPSDTAIWLYAMTAGMAAARPSAVANSWIAFAATGDPNNRSIPTWAPYDLQRRNTMLFDVPSVAVDDPHREEREFMARYASQQDGGNALHRRALED